MSYAGLRGLDLPDDVLVTFASEFRQGMEQRAAGNGDTGPSDPARWDAVWRGRRVHLLVITHARSAAALDDAARQLDALSPDPLRRLGAEAASMMLGSWNMLRGRPYPIEHFGFPDGISDPAVAGVHSHGSDGCFEAGDGGGWRPLSAGEFLLGLADEAGELPLAPSPEPLARNGSYLVLRKLKQRVHTFNAYLTNEAGRLGVERSWLAGKLMGRHYDGRPLALHAIGVEGFTYAKDSEGRGCPLGSHVRRANPRDSFGNDTTLVNRHRILRRGITYGDRAGDAGDDAKEERGLMFVALNASIDRQFEFIQRQWINQGNELGQGDDRDPIAGSTQSGVGWQAKMIIPGSRDKGPRTVVCTGLHHFVETRGGDYFFLPGLRALAGLVDGGFRLGR
jgi:Dyp-type peroxidase family